jgi:hypothetical protein
MLHGPTNLTKPRQLGRSWVAAASLCITYVRATCGKCSNPRSADPRWVGSRLLLSIQVGSSNILLDDVPV